MGLIGPDRGPNPRLEYIGYRSIGPRLGPRLLYSRRPNRGISGDLKFDSKLLLNASTSRQVTTAEIAVKAV